MILCRFAIALGVLVALGRGAYADEPTDRTRLIDAAITVALGATYVVAEFGLDVSFWSGHTSLAFALAVSSGTVASSRGYDLAPLVWVAASRSPSRPATCESLRIATTRPTS
jgi:hypothetical protein